MGQDQENGLGVDVYRRSSLCATGSCIEVAISHDGLVKVRDNKDLSKAPLTFNADEWKAFIGGIKNREFDFLEV